MNILFAYNISDSDNQFVQLHIRFLKNLGYNVTASLNEFWEPSVTYDFLVINWPEYFFGWRPIITDEQVARLNIALIRWQKSKSKILTFFHDEYSHFGRGANLNLIFDLCYRKSDILIHLGEYSKRKYTNLYPDAEHHIVFHPLYSDFQTDLDKHSARKQLAISEKVYLVFVPGAIRKSAEIDYCLEIYRKLPAKNKQLIFQKTNFLARPQFFKNLIDLKVLGYYLLHTYRFKLLENVFFLQGFMEKETLSTYFASSDLVIIPRTDILNSGNILLAAQFGKPMIGTGAGNMGELLIHLKQQLIQQQIAPNLKISEPKIAADEIKQLVESYANDEIIKKKWQQILKP